jgi:cellulose biosynthesis protein BcsE
MKGKWQRVDTLVGMLHATRNMRTVTCILMFQQGSVLRQLAETVHTLRQSLGRYASIVVQEKDASLRYQNEALLLKLGLNLVINRDVPVSRLPLLFGSLKGQVFTRDVDINFEAALGSVLPSRASGYLIAQRFVREVEVVLERSETLDIPCAMVVGRPKSNIPMIDLVTNNGINRPGDLFSTDTENFFVFLSACPQTVLLPTLARLFRMPVDDVFGDVRFVVNREEMQAEMAALLRASEHETLPDFSEITAAQAQAQAQSRPPPPKELAPAQEFAPETLPRVAASPAQSAPVTPTEKPLPLGGLFKNAPAEAVAVAAPAPLIAPVPRYEAPIEAQFPRSVPKPAVKSPVKVVVAPPVLPTQEASDSVFEYDGMASIPTLGKKDAPRATRAVRAVH